MYNIRHTGTSMKPTPRKFLKFAPPGSLKILIHSLVLPVVFLCKKFSKLLKFILQNTLF